MMNSRMVAAGVVALALALPLSAGPAFAQAQRSPSPAFPYTQDPDTGAITFHVPVNIGNGITFGLSGDITTSRMPRLSGSGGISGLTSGGVSQPVASYRFNTDSDTVDGTFSAGVYNAYFGHAFGGSAAKKNRTGLLSLLIETSRSGNVVGDNAYYVALAADARSGVEDAGALGSPGSNLFGALMSSRLTTGARYWYSNIGAEIDIGVEGTATASYKRGLTIVQLSSDTSRGSVSDMAFNIANQANGSAPGWNCGICFGSELGWWPIHPTAGNIIGTEAAILGGGPAMAARSAIELSNVAFTTNYLNFANYTVDKDGNTTKSGSLLSTASTNTMRIQDSRNVAANVGGAIQLEGKNNSATLVAYGGIRSAAVSGTAGAEGGSLILQYMGNGTLTEGARVSNTGNGMFIMGGGQTASQVGFKRNLTTLQVRLGDDSSYGGFDAGSYMAAGVSGVSCPAGVVAGTVTISFGIVTHC